MTARTFQFTVASQSTVLGALAASLAPRSWVQLTPAPTGMQGAFVSNDGNATGTILAYGHTTPYNPISKRIQYYGNDHGSTYFRHSDYDLATNAFTPTPAEQITNSGFLASHMFDQWEVNPTTGDTWFKQYANGSIPIWRKTYAQAANSAWTLLYNESNAVANITGGNWWWSNSSFGAFTSAQGWFMHLNPGPVGGLFRVFNGQTGALTHSASNVMTSETLGGYGGSGAYSATYNCAVFGGFYNFGTNSISRQVWRLNANNTWTRLADMPTGYNLFGAGTDPGTPKGRLVADPRTGKFVCVSNGTVLELDPSLTPSSAVFTPVSTTNYPAALSNEALFVATEVAEHNVIVYTLANRSAQAMYIYKHG
jgi:hypothetical protein